MALHAAHEPQRQLQLGGQRLCPAADLAHQLHQIRVLQGESALLAQQGRVREVVGQAQQLIIALIQQRGLGIQRRVLLPLPGRSQLGRRQVHGAEGIAQLGGQIGKQQGKIFKIRLHGVSFPMPQAPNGSICTAGPVKPRKTLAALPQA